MEPLKVISPFEQFKQDFPLKIRMVAGNPAGKAKLHAQFMQWTAEERAELMALYQPLLDQAVENQLVRQAKKATKQAYQDARQALQLAKIEEVEIREEGRRKIAKLNIPALEQAVVETRIEWYRVK